MTEITAAKLKLVCLAIEAKRLRGELAMDEMLPPEALARISQETGHPVSLATFKRIDELGKLALRAHRTSILRNLRSPLNY